MRSKNQDTQRRSTLSDLSRPYISFPQYKRALKMQGTPVIDRLPPRLPRSTSHVQQFVARMVSGRCSIVESDSQMETILALRYRIYIQELKKNLPWADHENGRLPDPYDTEGATHFVVSRKGGQLVGCVRLHLGTSIPADMLEA